MKQSKVTGIIGTLVFHVLVLLLLFFFKLVVPEQEEEGGVPVMLGNMELAQGSSDPYTMTEVDVIPKQESSAPEIAEPEPEVEQPIITQTDEPSIQIKEEKKEEKKKSEDKEKKVEEKPVEPKVEKPKEKTEAEKRAEAEKAAAEAAASKIAGAFGKGSMMGSKGDATSGEGAQGNPQGNSSTGNNTGDGVSRTFDLNGRSLGSGGLPVPVYNVQEEGRVVVTIVVNPAGQVISTSINKRTNTVNPALRKAAEEAARKARFNAVDDVNNQSGTITYDFKLK